MTRGLSSLNGRARARGPPGQTMDRTPSAFAGLDRDQVSSIFADDELPLVRREP